VTRAEVVFAHLALDAAGIDSIAAGSDALLEDLLEYGEYGFMKGVPVLMGNSAKRAMRRWTTRVECTNEIRSGSSPACSAASCIKPRIEECAISKP
jgi:hypothetical protein